MAARGNLACRSKPCAAALGAEPHGDEERLAVTVAGAGQPRLHRFTTTVRHPSRGRLCRQPDLTGVSPYRLHQSRPFEDVPHGYRPFTTLRPDVVLAELRRYPKTREGREGPPMG
jgi:hypothetical protein